VVVLAWAAWTRRGAERDRALGLTAFLLGAAVLIAGIAYARAAVVPQQGLPPRYALLIAPAFCAASFAWELYGRPSARVVVPLLLLAATVAVMPDNLRKGRYWCRWYRDGMESVIRDVEAGSSAPDVARRHASFLRHWDERGLEERIGMLQRARIGPFARLNGGPRADLDSEPPRWRDLLAPRAQEGHQRLLDTGGERDRRGLPQDAWRLAVGGDECRAARARRDVGLEIRADVPGQDTLEVLHEQPHARGAGHLTHRFTPTSSPR
jgi:hypothetical protein